MLALRKREIVSGWHSRATARAVDAAPVTEDCTSMSSETPIAADGPPRAPFESREALAKAARLSSNQVVMIEKIQKQAAPEVVAAVKAGTISINAAAAVATLPAEQQVAAASGGKDELRQAAKRVRESKRKPREESAVTPEAPGQLDELQVLRQRVAELTAENESLRRRLAELTEAQAAE